MIAPPNHGSNLAHFGFALDITEAIGDRVRRKESSAFYAAIEDGLLEASIDLAPDSVFLKKLNDRDRNPRVAYSIFLGTRGFLTEEERASLVEYLEIERRDGTASLTVEHHEPTRAEAVEAALKRIFANGVVNDVHAGAFGQPHRLFVKVHDRVADDCVGPGCERELRFLLGRDRADYQRPATFGQLNQYLTDTAGRSVDQCSVSRRQGKGAVA